MTSQNKLIDRILGNTSQNKLKNKVIGNVCLVYQLEEDQLEEDSSVYTYFPKYNMFVKGRWG